MMKSILIILLITFSLTDSYSQLSKTEYEDVVKYFVGCIKDKDIDKLNSIISYPIQRPYPIPPIRNKQEFKNRYSEIFDDNLTSSITNSNIKEDWSDLGWRGIMLHNGIVWIDYNGKLTAINYTSDKEKSIEEKWIKYQKELLHTDLKNFKKPIHTIESDKFIVRIDLLENEKYRYASWSKHSEISSKPNLVINKGERRADGSSGNHYFTFVNGEYRYIVYVNIFGTNETPLFNLEVIKNDKVLLKQPAKLKEIK